MKPCVAMCEGDLPEGLEWGECVAIDTETMGLVLPRDRLCLLQLCGEDGQCAIIRFNSGQQYQAPRLQALLRNQKITKLFHFARFDVKVLRTYLGVWAEPIYCTKIASKLARTYSDRHGLRDLCRELLGVELSKQQQSSDWGRDDLTQKQLQYAVMDVYYLHRLRRLLEQMLVREKRSLLAEYCFRAVPVMVSLEIAGWEPAEVFSH